MAFALGWLALAQVVVAARPGAAGGAGGDRRGDARSSLGRFAARDGLGASWVVWCLLGRWTEVGLRAALLGLVGLTVAVLPGLAINLGRARRSWARCRADRFLALERRAAKPAAHAAALVADAAVAVLRMLSGAGSAYALLDHGRSNRARAEEARDGATNRAFGPPPRLRLVVTLAVILVGLGAPGMPSRCCTRSA